MMMMTTTTTTTIIIMCMPDNYQFTDTVHRRQHEHRKKLWTCARQQHMVLTLGEQYDWDK